MVADQEVEVEVGGVRQMAKMRAELNGNSMNVTFPGLEGKEVRVVPQPIPEDSTPL